MPDHLEAHRGLALAFDGETREGSATGRVTSATAACSTIPSPLCTRSANWVPTNRRSPARLVGSIRTMAATKKAANASKGAADRLDDWRRSVPLYKTAISVYYHAYYTGRGDHMEACVRCHRRARQLVPTDWPPRRRFALWQPSGMSMAYAHLGLSQEVFNELEALKAAERGRVVSGGALPILRYLLQPVPGKRVGGTR